MAFDNEDKVYESQAAATTQDTPLYVHILSQALHANSLFKGPLLVQDLLSQLFALSVYPH